MYIPHADTPLTPAPPFRPYHMLLGETSNKPNGGWSSIIGIVTAICGNILISFALNTQRYAHLKLQQGREEQEEEVKASQRQDSGRRDGYGTQQRDIAEERAKKNAESDPNGKLTLEEEHEISESDPLIPHVQSRNASTTSESTIRANEKTQDQPKEKSYLKSPYWWVGIALMTVGEAGNFLAYGFAPASIVSPLGVVALISNCLIAPLMLHEKFRWRDALGVVIAVGGCVTVVMSASGSNPKLDADEIWHLITRWEFETYLGITVFLIIVLMALSNKYGEKTILIDIGLVGLFGGYTALSTKGVASLLSNTIWRAVTFPITYLLVAVLVGTAVMQIKYINRALQRFNATMVIPTQFVMFTLSVIVGSAVLYRDFEKKTAEDAGEFIGGCALTFLGVWFITSGRGKDQSSDEEFVEEDDAVDLVDEEGQQPEIREREDRRQSILGGPSVRPQSPTRLHTSASDVPSITVTPDLQPQKSPSTPLFNLDEPSPLTNNPWNVPVGAANISAIHAKSTDQLPQDQGDTRKPAMHATTSAPVVPTTNFTPSSYRPRTPLNRNMTGPASPSILRDTPPQTPQSRQQSQGQYLDPGANAGPHKLLSRNSIAGILPGPLTSPLSSSLSAIVADSLRRGVDTSGSVRRRSFARRRSGRPGMGAAKRSSAAQAKRASVATMEGDDTGFDIEDESRDNIGSPKGRGRSFSTSIGELFRTKRPRLGSHEARQEQSGEGRQDEER